MADAHSPSDAPQRLTAIRGEIDSVDQELLALFNRRAALSLEVGRIKAGDPGIVFKPLREREVLDGLARKNDGHLRAIWREIFSSSRALQRPQNVAYLGPEGTFSYFAGVEYLGHAASFHPCNDLPQVFADVHSGRCELGVVPLENSLQGTVGVSFDLFLKYDVHIQAELFSPISHCLLSHAASLAEITTVYSHPQPLAQCGGWLRSHLPQAGLIPVESTAAAARRIEDEPGNWTRFVIIGPKPVGQLDKLPRTAPVPGHTGADKTSMLFTLPDKSGTLSGVLSLLAEHKINMRKLESRPLRGQCWKYVFFTDVECDLTAPQYEDLLRKLAETCTSFRILGSYATGPQLDRIGLEDSHA